MGGGGVINCGEVDSCVCVCVQVTLLLTDQTLRDGEDQTLLTQVTDYNQRMSGQWRPVSGCGLTSDLTLPSPPPVVALPLRRAHHPDPPLEKPVHRTRIAAHIQTAHPVHLGVGGALPAEPV